MYRRAFQGYGLIEEQQPEWPGRIATQHHPLITVEKGQNRKPCHICTCPTESLGILYNSFDPTLPLGRFHIIDSHALTITLGICFKAWNGGKLAQLLRKV